MFSKSLLPEILGKTLSIMVLACSPLLATELCPDFKDTVQFDPTSHELCSTLWPQIRQASDSNGTPKPLDEYETQVGQFFNNNCHRDPQLKNTNGVGWGRDKDVRDTGPFVAHRDENNEWKGEYHGFHSPVVIWYSPNMMEWLQRNRPADKATSPTQIEPVPDGVIIAKEMYTQPASRCRGLDIDKMIPANGIAYMIRDQKAAHDGWFWGYFAHFKKSEKDTNVDWPPRTSNGAAYAGFGQYCVNCHASAANNFTFSDLANIKGQPGEPLTYLSQDWFLNEYEGAKPFHAQLQEPIPANNNEITDTLEFDSRFSLPPGETLGSVASFTLPSQTYDNVWVKPGDTSPPLSSEYVTSDQCAGCHDAGSTGLSFDMTEPNPHGDNLFNLSPYATWRSSPMGLAGRDPIFYGQLASEEALHSESLELIWDTCFGCHGIMGQRQFKLDKSLDVATTAGNECQSTPAFTPDIVTAVPYRFAQTQDKSAPHYDLEMSKYGALARDGISCVACHRSVLTPEQTAQYGDQQQNDCIKVRQNTLNANAELGELTGLSKTFTGSFLVSDPGTLFGPFDNPKTVPMTQALNNIPEHDPSIASSEQCGTCHTVHLPVLWAPKGEKPIIIADTYEQTTYPEWLFSAYRTGNAAFLPKGTLLPGGAGETPRSCADCHMESHSEDGTPFVSKIASIQERTNMPEAAYTLDAEDIDLQQHSGFARHTLVGLNLFLVKMAEQFNHILGIPLQDPMLTTKGVNGLERTAEKMIENAKIHTANISIIKPNISHQALEVDVRIDNLAGHKFPSGVSFRRAFIEFEVLSQDGVSLWHSGGTDKFGILTDSTDKPLDGELWYDNSCNKIVDQNSYQPHYQVITKPEQVQIYQEVKLNPGNPEKVIGLPSCEHDAPVEASANLTTSFLSICHTAKDNRLQPAGLLPFNSRVAIAEKLGLINNNQAEKLAIETGSEGVGSDPDYVTGGGDTIRYRIALTELPQTPYSVRATLHYQATPPFFLQDRFCNGEGANRDRLFHIARLLETEGTAIEDWKFELVSTGEVPIRSN